MQKETTIPDNELLQRISAGDEAAFAVMFERYRGKLTVFLTNFLKSEAVAEELVQDVFIKLWQGRESLKDVQDLNAFLYRVARNKAIDFFRAAKKDSKLKEGIYRLLSGEQADAADRDLLYREYEAGLRAALQLLPPQQARAWHLSKEKNKSHLEIAEIMGISKTTVNTHITEANKFIRRHLSQTFDLALIIVLLNSN